MWVGEDIGGRWFHYGCMFISDSSQAHLFVILRGCTCVWACTGVAMSQDPYLMRLDAHSEAFWHTMIARAQDLG